MDQDERSDASAEETTAMVPGDMTGQTISGYRIVQLLGEGGMGVVYEAQQEQPVRRRVALKLIKPGMDTGEVLARFESERQALALMNHPNIASIYEGGATEDGRPFFAMEMVQGEPLTEYCDRNRLTVRQRLDLFMQVCEGVQYAHQKGVIHRDIKPSNILVLIRDGAPVPKIIDFGLAKATSHRLTEKTLFTQLGQMMGTPVYMSPEQAEVTGVDIDTRTDVYSLGVVLYELLSGAQPFDATELKKAGFDGLRRILREKEPVKPSTKVSSAGELTTQVARNRRVMAAALQKELRGDLDWITMKALEKDRTRRYASPSEFAADIRRHLRHDPVLAGPPSTPYRVRKFVRRHRAGVTAATLALAGLVTFAAAMTVQSVRIARERDRANREAATAQRVSDFLVDLFAVSDPDEARGNTVTAREILDSGADKIERELAEEPLVQARLLATMGRVYRRLGLFREARPLLEKALEIREAQLGEWDPAVAESLLALAGLISDSGDYKAARGYYERALAIRERNLEPDDPALASTLNSVALGLSKLGDYDAARPLFERALAIWEERGIEDPTTVALTLTNLANLIVDSGGLDEARPLYQKALAIQEERLGTDHPETARTLDNLAILELFADNLETARRLFERVLEIRTLLYGADHPFTAGTMNNLAHVLEKLGDREGAKALLECSIAILETHYGSEHPDVAAAKATLGALLFGGGEDLARSRQLLEQALVVFEARLDPNHRNIVDCLSQLAPLCRAMGDPSSAWLHYERLLAIRESTLELGDPHVARTLYDMACLAATAGDRERAIALLRQSSDGGFRFSGVGEDPDLASLRGDPRFEEIRAIMTQPGRE